MKRYKRYIAFLLVLATCAAVMVVSVTATATAAPRCEAAVADPQAACTPPVLQPAVIASADFAVVYTDVDQLAKAATVIVRGEVTRVSYLDFNSTAYTETTLKVSACLKGGLSAGDEVTIAEVGGVTSMAMVNGDKFGPPTAKDAQTKVSVLLDGAPLTQVGDKCVYFLGLGSIGVVPGTYYVPLGAFQGRFKIDGSLAERFVPPGWGDKYTSLATAEGAIDQAVLRATLDK